MLKVLSSSILLFFLLFKVVSANVIDIDNKEIKILLEKKIPIIDIRTKREWNETGVIPNSILITFFDENGNYSLNEWYKKLLKVSSNHNKIILICRTGRRTKLAGNMINKKLEIVVYNAKYGIKSWINSKLNIVKY